MVIGDDELVHVSEALMPQAVAACCFAGRAAVAVPCLPDRWQPEPLPYTKHGIRCLELNTN